jgi:hypothetical protein
MNAGTRPDPGQLPFRRIINAPLQTCLAAIDNGQRTQPDGQLRIGHSRIHGPSSTTATPEHTRSRSAWPADHCAPCCACA